MINFVIFGNFFPINIIANGTINIINVKIFDTMKYNKSIFALLLKTPLTL